MNGASPERLRTLQQDFKMQVIQLPANYRCPPEVINLANQLISHNAARTVGKEPLYAVKSSLGTNAVRLRSFDSAVEESAWVTRDISQDVHREPRECVVLARTKKLLESAARSFEAAGVKASLALRKNEFESVPLRWLHAILRLANARADREQLRRVCKTFYELEGINVEVDGAVARAAAVDGDYLRSWWEHVLLRSELEPDTQDFLMRARDQIVDRLVSGGEDGSITAEPIGTAPPRLDGGVPGP